MKVYLEGGPFGGMEVHRAFPELPVHAGKAPELRGRYCATGRTFAGLRVFTWEREQRSVVITNHIVAGNADARTIQQIAGKRIGAHA